MFLSRVKKILKGMFILILWYSFKYNIEEMLGYLGVVILFFFLSVVLGYLFEIVFLNGLLFKILFYFL